LIPPLTVDESTIDDGLLIFEHSVSRAEEDYL
jgi:hypothetical protein